VQAEQRDFSEMRRIQMRYHMKLQA